MAALYIFFQSFRSTGFAKLRTAELAVEWMKVPATLSDPKGPHDFTFYIPFPSLDMLPVQAAPLLTEMLTGKVVGTAMGGHMKRLLDKMNWHHVPICEDLKAARSFAFYQYKPFATGERITGVVFATYVFVLRATAVLQGSAGKILGDDGTVWVEPLHCFHNVVDQTLLSLEGQQSHITSEVLHDYDIWARFNASTLNIVSHILPKISLRTSGLPK